METVQIGELTMYVADLSGDQVIEELSRSLHWSISDFKFGKWQIEPLADSTTIPAQAKHRIELIQGTGVTVEWYIAHEIMPEPIVISQDDLELALKVGLVIAGVAAVVLLLPVIFFCLMLWVVSCTSGDPALVARVYNQNGEEKWISLYRWYQNS